MGSVSTLVSNPDNPDNPDNSLIMYYLPPPEPTLINPYKPLYPYIYVLCLLYRLHIPPFMWKGLDMVTMILKGDNDSDEGSENDHNNNQNEGEGSENHTHVMVVPPVLIKYAEGSESNGERSESESEGSENEHDEDEELLGGYSEEGYSEMEPEEK